MLMTNNQKGDNNTPSTTTMILYLTGAEADRFLDLPLSDQTQILAVVKNGKESLYNFIKETARFLFRANKKLSFQSLIKDGLAVIRPASVRFHGYQTISLSELSTYNYDFVYYASIRIRPDTLAQLNKAGVPSEKIINFDLQFVTCGINNGFDHIINFNNVEKRVIPFQYDPPVIEHPAQSETSKAKSRRVQEGFFENYCQGKGLDIGYGEDILTPDCSGWEYYNGDAQYLESIPDESFDYVYSSHCIEHMLDVRTTLANWFRVVKKGGYLMIYLPDRDLYEKRGSLPSKWNSDHKHMFLIDKSESPDTLNILEEIENSVDHYKLIYAKRCDEGHTITDPELPSDGEYSIEVVLQKL
jgi:SAM-dependent methyltransferase